MHHSIAVAVRDERGLRDAPAKRFSFETYGITHSVIAANCATRVLTDIFAPFGQSTFRRARG